MSTRSLRSCCISDALQSVWPCFTYVLQEFDESYLQTGQGQLYSWSSQTHQRAGSPIVLRCNHTTIYEGQEERQGPVLQLLKVSGMKSVYHMFTLTLDFYVTASLLIPGPGKILMSSTSLHHRDYRMQTFQQLTLTLFTDGYEDACPQGFKLDTASYCAGMLLTLFVSHLSSGNTYRNICHWATVFITVKK